MLIHHRLSPCGFPMRALVLSSMVEHGLSRFPFLEFPHMLGVLDHAEPALILQYRCLQFCLPSQRTVSALCFRDFSRLNTQPVCATVNASRISLRLSAHDSWS